VTADISPAMRSLLERECSGQSVLDFGGGDGERYGRLVREQAAKYAVADVSPAVLAARKELGDLPIALDELPNYESAFDVALMLEVAEHLVDPVAGLKAAVSAVRPGGRIIVSVPNAFSLVNRLRMLAGRLPASGVGAPGLAGKTYLAPHIRFFDERSLRALASDAHIGVDALLADGRDFGPHPRLQRVGIRLEKPSALWTNTLVLLGRRPTAAQTR